MRSDLVIALSTVALVACTWDTPLPSLPPPPANAPAIRADRELVVTDDAVLASHSRNADDAFLSFAHRADAMGLTLADVDTWLLAWAMRLRAEQRPDRAELLESRVRCAWLRRNPANSCDDTCACTGQTLRASDAPFRLVAVVNRTDLADMPDRKGAGGEGRLVYAVTAGPADDPASPALPLAVIFEYTQNESAKAAAKRWHTVADAPDATFGEALVEVVSSFGPIAQVRTADALVAPLLLHQFELVQNSGFDTIPRLAGTSLVARPVRNTPNWAAFSEDQLKNWVIGDANALVNGTAVMPTRWWAASSAADDVSPPWLDGIADHERVTDGTCAGCHAKSESGFQIDPQKTGSARLSKFLLDPTANEDELRRRTLWLQRKMVEPDPPPPPPPTHGGGGW